MTTVRAKLLYFERMRHEHALLLSCACAAILFFSFPFSKANWAVFDWSNENTQPNEAEIDSALQEAATAALGQRDGAIIIMDPQTGRVRAGRSDGENCRAETHDERAAENAEPAACACAAKLVEEKKSPENAEEAV